VKPPSLNFLKGTRRVKSESRIQGIPLALQPPLATLIHTRFITHILQTKKKKKKKKVKNEEANGNFPVSSFPDGKPNPSMLHPLIVYNAASGCIDPYRIRRNAADELFIFHLARRVCFSLSLSLSLSLVRAPLYVQFDAPFFSITKARLIARVGKSLLLFCSLLRRAPQDIVSPS
jgi:hypothetical protein